MSPLLQSAGVLVASLLAAGAVLARVPRARAWCMLGALVVTPVLLVAHIWDTPQLEAVRERGALAAGAAAAGALVVAGLALLMARRPQMLPLAAAAALPFRVPVESGGATANLLVPLYVVLGAGALAWLVPRLRGGGGARDRDAAGWLVLGAVVLYALQTSYSPDREKALEQIVFFYVPFGLLFALLREIDWTPALLRRCGAVLLGLALLFALVGFVEYQQRELLLNPKVIASNQLEEYFRVNSLFFDPNIYGRFLAVVMTGLAGILLWTRTPRAVLLSALALAVLWGGLLLTLSQSSFAALAIALVVLAALRWRLRRALATGAILALLGIAVVLAFPGTFKVDLGDPESLDKASSGRYALLKGGVELARDRPLQGWGAGSFEHEFRRQEKASSRQAATASHTIPVTVAAEQGVPGLALYLALLAAALAHMLRGARRTPARAVVAAAFTGLVLHTWLYAAFLEDPLAWALLAVGTALRPEEP